MTITAAQVKEARELLDLTTPALAKQSGIDARHLEGFERGKRRLSVLDLSVVQRVFEAAGVRFIAEQGGGARVRLRNPP
jgi:transcriptional regulator with XRE-family HTH domain